MRRDLTALRQELATEGFQGELIADCALAPFTTWRVGGPADLVASPTDRDDLVLAVSRAEAHGIPWRVLGNGSNLLVDDQGVRGLVLRLRKVLDGVTVRDTTLDAGAGALFPSVANQAAARGLAGIEFGTGIPGTIGGAVIMNAGWHQYEIGNCVRHVEWLGPSGSIDRVTRDACRFRYRGSRFRDTQGIVVSATLELERGDPDEIRARLDGFARSRKENQPTDLPSCGSVFLKPPGDFAGRLIEEAGLKGLRVGDAQVSEKHANFIVNLGSATCEEILELVEHVEGEVDRKFGVRLVREFELWR